MNGQVAGSFTLLPAEEVDQAARMEVDVSLTIAGRDSAVVGRLLDLIEHAVRLGGMEATMVVPGYHNRAFYGWEKEQE